MLQRHGNAGGSVVLRRGLVVNGYGQRGAQHGLTCPGRGQGHERAWQEQPDTMLAWWCFMAAS